MGGIGCGLGGLYDSAVLMNIESGLVDVFYVCIEDRAAMCSVVVCRDYR